MEKSKLIQTLRLHYLSWFIISSIIIGLVSVIKILQSRNNPNAHPVDFEMIIGLILIVIAMTVLLGGIFHLHHEFYRPWRQKRLLFKKAMVGFEKLGFNKDLENLCYSGYLDNYYINLVPITTPTSGEWINANAFLFLNEHQTDDLENLADSYNIEFNEGLFWATTKIILRFNKDLNINKVKSQLEDFINEIKRNNIEPLKITNDNKANS